MLVGNYCVRKAKLKNEFNYHLLFPITYPILTIIFIFMFIFYVPDILLGIRKLKKYIKQNISLFQKGDEIKIVNNPIENKELYLKLDTFTDKFFYDSDGKKHLYKSLYKFENISLKNRMLLEQKSKDDKLSEEFINQLNKKS